MAIAANRWRQTDGGKRGDWRTDGPPRDRQGARPRLLSPSDSTAIERRDPMRAIDASQPQASIEPSPGVLTQPDFRAMR